MDKNYGVINLIISCPLTKLSGYMIRDRKVHTYNVMLDKGIVNYDQF